VLSRLDARLADQDFLGGATRGFADIAIFPFVRQFSGVDPAWFGSEAPSNVLGWLAALIESESVRARDGSADAMDRGKGLNRCGPFAAADKWSAMPICAP
jgi:glutathione S-transferase